MSKLLVLNQTKQFKVILFEDRNQFYELIKEAFKEYMDLISDSGDIPMLEMFLEYHQEYEGSSKLFNFMDEEFYWMNHFKEPNHIPQPGSYDFRTGDWENELQNVLCECWGEGLASDYMHDIALAFNQLNFVYYVDNGRTLMNAPVLEVW